MFLCLGVVEKKAPQAGPLRDGRAGEGKRGFMSEDEARGKRRRADEPAAAPAAAPATASAAAPDDVQAKIDYQKAGAYWDSVDATIDGVLGGFGHLTDVDLRDSHAFFQRQPSLAPRTPRPGTLACDCGAGIGRVAKGLLLDYCEKVDIVEQCKKYTDASWRFVGKERIREVLTVGLQVSLPSAPHPFPVPCPLRHAPAPWPVPTLPTANRGCLVRISTRRQPPTTWSGSNG